MSVKIRLVRLEKLHCDTDLVAFFSMPKELSSLERLQIKKDYWNQYLKEGGNPNAKPAFVDGLETQPGFIRVLKIADVLAEIEKNKNPIKNV